MIHILLKEEEKYRQRQKIKICETADKFGGFSPKKGERREERNNDEKK
jgi:hypothetical protein